nr:MAG TPA: hypothetical protein [Caudoviricetes sp.]DAV07149.1 MAG TPA: hypothetical protein [Caudoviricetes sp.]
MQRKIKRSPRRRALNSIHHINEQTEEWTK